MTPAPIFFALLAVLVAAAAITGRNAWVKAMAFVASIVLVIVLWDDCLGLPRPEFLGRPAGIIQSFVMDEPNNIYLWVVAKPGARPVAYALPWSDKLAKELYDEFTQAVQNHEKVMVAPGPQGARRFYPVHNRESPPKTIQKN